MSNIFERVEEFVEVKVTIKEEALADKVFEKAVDPLMLKLTEIIPTEFDNLLYKTKKEEFKQFFREALVKGVDVLEEKTGMDLDGKAEE